MKEKESCCGECANFLAYCNLCGLRGTFHKGWNTGKDACLEGFTPGIPVEFEDTEETDKSNGV